MARVAFFTERLPPSSDPIASFSYSLMYSLAQQQHEVQVYSTYRSGEDLPPMHSRLQILRPFQRWSWMELPALLPNLISFSPQILHVIQPHARAVRGLTNAMSALPSLAPLIGKPRIVTTYYDLNSQRLSAHKLLLTGTHLATVSNSYQRARLLNYTGNFKRRRPRVEILPVPGFRQHMREKTWLAYPGFSDDERESAIESTMPYADETEHLSDYLSQRGDLLFIPGDLDRHLQVDQLFRILSEFLLMHTTCFVLFGGGWGSVLSSDRKKLMRTFESAGLGGRIFISGPISEEVEFHCLKRSLLVLLASLTPESLSLTRLLRTVLSSATAVPIMSFSQAAIDALPWNDNEQAILTEDSPASWRAGLERALRSPQLVRNIQQQLPEFARLETLDQPGNVMSRLYAGLLDSNW